jgi:hypothetical protein
MKARGRSALAKFSVPLSWRYGRDLTDAARRGQLDPVIGRDEELARLIQILGRKTKNNPVLIGKSGVGKTAIVEGLALRIAEGVVPPVLLGKRLAFTYRTRPAQPEAVAALAAGRDCLAVLPSGAGKSARPHDNAPA